jgi:BirA family transcriptional regulator, biotin operon repressor / biotin---[acetyl-CoA-carboxylase] ligase
MGVKRSSVSAFKRSRNRAVEPWTTLSPAAVRQIVMEEEISCRSRDFPPETLHAILRYGAPVGAVIEHHPCLHRGMEYARRLIAEKEEQGLSFPTGTVIMADELTGGQGRFRRAWHAPPGGLWLTLVLVNTLLPAATRLFPLAAGLACCEAVRSYGIDARLKWVNDIHVAGRKLAGILTETMVGPRYREEYILIGVGVNVNNLQFPAELSSLAVSVRGLLGREIELQLFAARLLAKFVWNIGMLHFEEQCQLEEDGGPGQERQSLLLASWRRLSDTIGRRVRFGYDVQIQPQYEAQVMALDVDGALVLRMLPDGQLVTEHSGEIIYLE